MRFRTRDIQLEAVRYDGQAIPAFAEGRVVSGRKGEALTVTTAEGERRCGLGDYLVLTDAGQFLVRNGAIFETIFEPAP